MRISPLYLTHTDGTPVIGTAISSLPDWNYSYCGTAGQDALWCWQEDQINWWALGDITPGLVGDPREIRRIKPDIVICQDPTNRFGDNHINHPDHRAAGDAALDCIYPSARDYHAFPQLINEGFMPHNVLEVYLTGPGGSTPTVIDISSTIEVKINALLEHRSQVGADNPERVEMLISRVKERANNLGKEFGVEYAEIFRYIALGR